MLKEGLVEGDDGDDCDFYVCEEDEAIIVIPSLMVPINGDAGIEQEDLPEGCNYFLMTGKIVSLNS